MAKPHSLASLGPCEQLAFIPSDFDAAIEHWTQKMGVGPFFLFENLQLENMRFRGEPTDARFSVAIAYWGDIQIELVRAENDAPAHYNGEYLIEDRLHHTLVFVDDMAVADVAIDQAGAEVVVEGRFGGAAVKYVDPGMGPGGMVEILETSQAGRELFAMIKAAAADWDGTDAVRRLG